VTLSSNDTECTSKECLCLVSLRIEIADSHLSALLRICHNDNERIFPCGFPGGYSCRISSSPFPLPPSDFLFSHTGLLVEGGEGGVDTRKQPFITYAAWMVSSTQRFRDNLSRVFTTARRGADGGDGGRLAVSTAHEMNSSLSSRANAPSAAS